jgi:uncharacterized membrane-anchored protein
MKNKKKYLFLSILFAIIIISGIIISFYLTIYYHQPKIVLIILDIDFLSMFFFIINLDKFYKTKEAI